MNSDDDHMIFLPYDKDPIISRTELIQTKSNKIVKMAQMLEYALEFMVERRDYVDELDEYTAKHWDHQEKIVRELIDRYYSDWVTYTNGAPHA